MIRAAFLALALLPPTAHEHINIVMRLSCRNTREATL